MQFTYQVSIDDDHTPWGSPEKIAEETQKINDGVWEAYVVTVRATGPVESEASVTGVVVPRTDTGYYRDLSAISDAHLRRTAQGLAEEVASTYRSKLTEKRDEIDAMLRMP